MANPNCRKYELRFCIRDFLEAESAKLRDAPWFNDFFERVCMFKVYARHMREERDKGKVTWRWPEDHIS